MHTRSAKYHNQRFPLHSLISLVRLFVVVVFCAVVGVEVCICVLVIIVAEDYGKA